MITTTSLISGFQILEFIKIIKLYYPNKYITTQYDDEINLYKNRFVNLNINYIDGINPVRPERVVLANSNIISPWTKIIVSTNQTFEVIDFINNFTQNNVEFLTCGEDTIFDGENILIEQIDFKNNVLSLIMLGDRPIELKIELKIN